MTALTVIQVLLALLLMGGTSHAQPEDQPEDLFVLPPEGVVMPRRAAPFPSAPSNLRFAKVEPVESQISLNWQHTGGGTGFKIYRRIEQLVATRLVDPDEGVSPLGWKEVGSLDIRQRVWSDQTIGPPDPDAPWSLLNVGPYCYMVVAYNEAGSSASDTICKRTRDVNEPSDVNVGDATPTSLTLTWQDNSQIEWGFQVIYARQGPPPDETIAIISTPDAERFVISGLTPDSEYCVLVRAVSYKTSSKQEGGCGRTLPGVGNGGDDEDDGPVAILIKTKMDVSNQFVECSASIDYRLDPVSLTGNEGRSTTVEFHQDFDLPSPETNPEQPNTWHCVWNALATDLRRGTWRITVTQPLWTSNCEVVLRGGPTASAFFAPNTPGCSQTGFPF